MESKYMQRAIYLAKGGQGMVDPNPMVGAVLVYQDKIISEGYHQQFGQQHAEIICFNNLKTTFRCPDILSKSTLYVSLEPCSHHGKTPPCANAIVNMGIKKVVIGCLDPNPIVMGRGVDILKKNGIEVVSNYLESECKQLNKRFFCLYQKKRPYIILKWAACSNGFIANKNYSSVFISNPYTNFITHNWRDRETAIMIGTNTARYDNPKLTTRLAYGKNPIRICIDKLLSIPQTYNIYNLESPTLIFNEIKNKEEGNIHFIKIDFSSVHFLDQILAHLYAKKILSVIVEGGTNLLTQFIEQNIWDEAREINSNTIKIIDGIKKPTLKNAIIKKHFKVGSDKIIFYKNTKL